MQSADEITPQPGDENDTFCSYILGDFIEIKSRPYPFFHGLGQVEEQALHQIGEYSQIVSSLQRRCQDALILGNMRIGQSKDIKLINRTSVVKPRSTMFSISVVTRDLAFSINGS